MANAFFPPLTLSEWQPTRDTLIIYAQILGKVRRAMTPKQKHWWHVSLRTTSVGVSTTPMRANNQTVELILDFTKHHLIMLTSTGERQTIPLQGQSAAAFCTELLDELAALGIEPEIDRSLFADDTPRTYDQTAVFNFWQALSQIDSALKAFRHTFREESSPVQLWPHHFDIAVVWLSGRLIPDQDPADEEYADEQMNFGFSTGDDSIAEPYFYATAYPTPDKFTDQPLPDNAYWQTEGFTAAILPYDALTKAADPHNKLQTFLQAAHQAGAQLMQS